VVAAAGGAGSARELSLREEIRVDGDSWLAARCGGPTYFDGAEHRGPWERRIFAHTSPIYVACSEEPWSRTDAANDRRMLALVEAGLEHVRRGRRYPEDRITHHHGEPAHEAFLTRPFLEARERVRRRMEP